MNILITGATGFIGSHILRALLQQQHTVTACVRNPVKLLLDHPLANSITLDFVKALNIEDWLPYLKDIDAVINCVGIIVENRTQSFSALHSQAPIALFKAAEQAGVDKVVQISALGADDTAQSDYHRSKKQADDALRQLSVDWFVLRPSIVYGDGAKSMALFQALATLPVQADIDGGQQMIQPIHVDDLTVTVLHCLDSGTKGQQTLDLVGPKPITMSRLLSQLRRRFGKPPAFAISVPGAIVENTAFIGRRLGEDTMTADNIRMLRGGNDAPVEPLRKFLGRTTASLEEKVFSRPASQAEYWHAHLYFLRPLIRLTLALVWTWSGIVSIFFYPQVDSYALLAATGITGTGAPLALYGLAITDIVLGLALLAAYKIRWVIAIQILVVVAYTLVISVTLPEFWLHPFGPILKNLPLVLLTLVYGTLEEAQS